jgi:hypothetical protein
VSGRYFELMCAFSFLGWNGMLRQCFTRCQALSSDQTQRRRSDHRP